jgi:hypothetical protein
MSDRLGVLFDETMDEYHNRSTAFGVHDLYYLYPHPLLFYKKFISKSIKDESDSKAKAFGRYFHSLALEGEDATKANFAVLPREAEGKTKAAIAAWDEFVKQYSGKEIVTEDDCKLAWRMVEAIREKPGICEILNPSLGRPEVTFRAQMPFYKLQCRSDWFLEKPPGGGPPMDVNVKTIDHLANFDQQFSKFDYYRGAAFYRAVMAKVLGLERMEPQMLFLVVEKNEPFQAVLRVPDTQSMEIGWKEIMRDLSTLTRCFETGMWPGEPDVMRPVSLPSWKVRQFEAQ